MSKKNMVIGHNRIALITGGSKGIGFAIGRLLAQRGSHVWLVARGPERLASALEALKAARQSDEQMLRTISADVSDPIQAAAAVEQVIQESGVPDLLVNSAGVARPGYFQELDLEAFHWMMDINYFGTVNMIKAVLPGMIRRGSGHIVNISSVVGFLGVFGYSAYGASKFAVSGLSEVLRSELKPHGINISIVFPPDVDTPQLAYESQFRPIETQGVVGGGPVMTPEAVAATIVRGISRRQYVILPGPIAKVLYPLVHILGNGAHPIIDFMIVRAQKQANKKV